MQYWIDLSERMAWRARREVETPPANLPDAIVENVQGQASSELTGMLRRDRGTPAQNTAAWLWERGIVVTASDVVEFVQILNSRRKTVEEKVSAIVEHLSNKFDKSQKSSRCDIRKGHPNFREGHFQEPNTLMLYEIANNLP